MSESRQLSSTLLNGIKKISQSGDMIEKKIEEKVAASLIYLNKDVNELIKKAKTELENFDLNTSALVEQTVQNYLKPHMEEIILKVTQSLSEKIDAILTEASKEFLKQAMQSYENLATVRMEEELLKKKIDDFNEQFDLQQQLQKSVENEFKELMNALSVRVQNYSTIVEMQGEVKESQSFKEAKLQRLQRKKIEISQRMELLLQKINSLVNDLNNDNKKYNTGKDAIAVLRKSIEEKEKKNKNCDEDKTNLKIVLDGMERLKLNYAYKYDTFNKDTKEFVEYLSTLKKTETLLITTEAKENVENIALSPALSQITRNVTSL